MLWARLRRTFSSTIPQSALTLGALSLSSNALLSPLEGVSDAGFRALCAANGAALGFTEMVRATAVARRNAAALALIDPLPPQRGATGVQLLAGSAEELLAALRTLEELALAPQFSHFAHLRAVDVNLGCPSPAVIGEGKGPALLKRRAKLAALFSALRRWREGNSLGVAAVGAKLRLGLTAREAAMGVGEDAAACAADAGLDFVTVHGRHAGQGSSEPASWEAVGRAVAAVRAVGAGTRVILNGDVRSAACARAALARSGADGVMVARAAFRTPAVFRELAASGEAAPADPPAGLQRGWSGGGEWLSEAEVDAAFLRWREDSAATPGGAREKHRVFHAANFARLREAAANPQLRHLPPPRVASEHLS